MATEKLPAMLRDLHQALSDADTVDDASRRQLQEVASDIARILGSAEKPPPAHAATLAELAVRFESDHPALATAIKQLSDALSRVGL